MDEMLVLKEANDNHIEEHTVGEFIEFCENGRIDEGEARFVMIGTKLYRVEHYVYIGGVGGETKTTIFMADAQDFPDNEKHPFKTIQAKLEAELVAYLTALGLSER